MPLRAPRHNGALANLGCFLPDPAPSCCARRRTTPRWQLQQGIPARELRQGAFKQQLRDHEEAELELVRHARGLGRRSPSLLDGPNAGNDATLTQSPQLSCRNRRDAQHLVPQSVPATQRESQLCASVHANLASAHSSCCLPAAGPLWPGCSDLSGHQSRQPAGQPASRLCLGRL